MYSAHGLGAVYNIIDVIFTFCFTGELNCRCPGGHTHPPVTNHHLSVQSSAAATPSVRRWSCFAPAESSAWSASSSSCSRAYCYYIPSNRYSTTTTYHLTGTVYPPTGTVYHPTGTVYPVYWRMAQIRISEMDRLWDIRMTDKWKLVDTRNRDGFDIINGAWPEWYVTKSSL